MQQVRARKERPAAQCQKNPQTGFELDASPFSPPCSVAQSNCRCDRYRTRKSILGITSKAESSRTRINKDRTAGIEPRCDFRTAIPLLDLAKAIATAWGGSRVLSLTQQPTHAAYGVFCGLQVTEFDVFFRSFLCHFILLSICFGLP